LLIGFLLAILPLLFAFADAALTIDKMAAQSRFALQQAVKISHANRDLIEQITRMERSARQYLILGDKAILENIPQAHSNFLNTAQELLRQRLDVRQTEHLSSLIEREIAVVRVLQKDTNNAHEMQSAVVELAELLQQSQILLTENSHLIDREAETLQKTAEHARRSMFFRALALIPLALLIAIVISVLIARPLRRIDEAMQQLGRGQLADPIQIPGPDDLYQLGLRLDWLRLQLLDLEEQKNRFLRHISHELKTPLTAIREGAELLSEEVTGKLSQGQREIAEILRQNSLRLQKQIENLLSYSSAQFQSLPLQTSKVDLGLLIKSVAQDHVLALSSKQIKLELKLNEVSLYGDTSKLATVIDNLLSNAIKFSPRGATITVQLTVSMKQAIMDVLDQGQGIAEEDRERLFEPFYQGSTPHDGHVKGSGLGLSIAREFVLAHGGHIDAVDSLGGGAHMRVTLPLTSV